jgi:hypothetical protein
MTKKLGRCFPHRIVGILVAAMLVSGFGIWSWIGSEQNDRIQEAVRESLAKLARTRQLNWQEQDQFVYELSLDGVVTLNPGNVNAGIATYTLDGLLCMRVLETLNGKTEVGMQLSKLVREHQGEPDARLLSALSMPFVVQFKGGMPLTFRFPEGQNGDVQKELSELIRGFQVMLPDQPSRQWNALETNQDGQYRSSYQIDSNGVWNKNKLSYVSVGEVANALNVDKIQVIQSLATFKPSKKKGWWQEAEMVDELEFLISSRSFIKVKKRSALKLINNDCDLDLELANISNVNDLLAIIVNDEHAGDQLVVTDILVAGPEDRKKFNRLTLAFIETKAKNLNDVHDIASMLKTFPELAAEIPSLLMQDDIAEMSEAGFIHALELAGNEVSQRALSDITSEPAYEYSNRLRSIIGLSGVENPEPRSVETLWKISGYRGAGPEGENLANTALLALGSMSKNLREAGDDRYHDLSSRLGADLAGQDSGTKVIILTAMSNSKDPSLLPYATQELEALQPMVRTAAIEAIASVDSPESFDLIFSRLSYEDNDRVRKALVEGISRLTYKDGHVLESFVQMIATEENKEVRSSIAMYLAENIDMYKASRTAIEKFLNDSRNSANSRADVSSKMRANSRALSTSRP